MQRAVHARRALKIRAIAKLAVSSRMDNIKLDSMRQTNSERKAALWSPFFFGHQICLLFFIDYACSLPSFMPDRLYPSHLFAFIHHACSLLSFISFLRFLSHSCSSFGIFCKRFSDVCTISTKFDSKALVLEGFECKMYIRTQKRSTSCYESLDSYDSSSSNVHTNANF